ncbi:N-acetylmuramic acid-specific phosphotransferase system enzyme IIBC component [Tetragenococcus halophilus subsp. halophilus]|uniref:PTS transporter subunit EIIC n=1 Tax=Tetragenococcus halophilus TaxID=51669 RepID=A0AB35HRW6_TETHA|nr:PTS transporter subunit EIIC [Tetragenococcus halophilus]MCO8285009.1 PTS transporter subunit EIIC [Tetragenococcus halophilus]MCO8291144.1 PTS transporter subunit EIIC [Tetragenococcus halophilus]MCO8295709.1 PTS transporter subunit EIIC [Tetragenococcus halophilus]MCO8298893.1 PTS transporter subunit EIIC [Tetragenococcus halophilus]MCT8309709.1 PTS transporter subunit EIIC [Tetragenococcus halophilus]
MADKVTKLAEEIYEYVGGVNNVNKIVNCMTRIRMGVIDGSKVDLDGLRAVDGVMGVVEDETLQIVLGPGTVSKVAQKMADMAGVELGEERPDGTAVEEPPTSTSGKEDVNAKAEEVHAQVKKKNQKPWSKVLKSIANIFVPLIPAFVGAGIIGGIASVLTNMLEAGTVSGDAWVNIVSVGSIIQSGVFTYLVIYVGINAAREFGASPSLGGVIGGVTMLTGMSEDMPLPNIFTGEPLAEGQGGVIGVIIAVFLMAQVEKWLHKVVPDTVDIIVTPVLTLAAMGIVTIFFIMPLAGWISDGLVGGITWVLGVGGGFAGFVLGTLFLPMVMFGLHQILTPIHLSLIETYGSTSLLPILAMAGAGQVGAAFALWLRCRNNKKLTEMIKGALPVGILGIGEPLIYGVTLPLGRPFITACLGGGIGGAVVGLLGGVGSISIGPSGLALIPLIAEGGWFVYVISLIAGYIGGFVLTYFFGTNEDIREGRIM